MLAIMRRILLLVVVYDLHVVGVPILPPKAHPPPIIDPDTVLTLPVSLQLLQTVARWDFEVVQTAGCMQDKGQTTSMTILPPALFSSIVVCASWSFSKGKFGPSLSLSSPDSTRETYS